LLPALFFTDKTIGNLVLLEILIVNSILIILLIDKLEDAHQNLQTILSDPLVASSNKYLGAGGAGALWI